MRKIYKVLIVGSGAAAYSAADWLYKENITDIAVVTENRLWGTSRNTGSDKQTYYKLSMDGISNDSFSKMAHDMFSGGSCDGEKMYIEAANSVKCFLRLCDYGIEFPTDEFGCYPGYKTDHDNAVRATSVGPLTSKIMTQKLENVVLDINKTPLFDNMQVIKILTHENRVYGITALNTRTNEAETIFAENVICATGAPACIYENSVYPELQHGMTGVLLEAGVRMCNFTQWQYGMASVDFRWNVSGSFMQVIPRFISVDENGIEREFLKDYFQDIHQAYSYVFLKGYQWPFSAERADESSAIDIAVHSETKKGRKVYLDFRTNPENFDFDKISDEAKEYINSASCFAETPIERLERLNSKAIDVYLRQGIDLYREKLRISVCAQHNNGGVYTDNNFETDVKGLYVIGEAAGTFGLSRPGGSALNNTQVSGLVAAKHIKNKEPISFNETVFEKNVVDFSQFREDEKTDYSYFKKKMSEVASFLRDYEGCTALLKEIKEVTENLPFSNVSLSQYYRDKDMLLSMQELLQAIVSELPETGSRGGAVFIKNGRKAEENLYYRDFLTITGNGKTEFVKVSAVPDKQRAFESYLSEINEDKLNCSEER